MNVPLIDLNQQISPLKEQILSKISKILDQTNFILGNELAEFEKNFAASHGSKYAIGVASGTDALFLSLKALGIQSGDEVILPANTFIATALGASFCGAIPRVVDVDPKTFLMDPVKVARAINSKTRAILPVHLYGRAQDLNPLISLANKHGLHLVEDCAQAHGAVIHGKKIGTFGKFGCFSFYPGKNLGAAGDGGLITTDDFDLYEKILALRNYGSLKKYYHPIIGFNSRLDTIQAAILDIKLPFLSEYNSKRYDAAVKYNESLKEVGDLVCPDIPEKGSHSFHLYVIRTKKRDELLSFLQKNGVGASIHYPTPIHLHGAFSHLGYKVGDFPISEQICDEILSLPLFPEITDAQILYVSEQIRGFFKNA